MLLCLALLCGCQRSAPLAIGQEAIATLSNGEESGMVRVWLPNGAAKWFAEVKPGTLVRIAGMPVNGRVPVLVLDGEHENVQCSIPAENLTPRPAK